MITAEQQLKRIQEKVQQVLKLNAGLQKENNRLKEELASVKEHTTDQQKSMEDLKRQVAVLKISAGEMNEGDKKELEKRINGYIKEIDRCIAMVSE